MLILVYVKLPLGLKRLNQCSPAFQPPPPGRGTPRIIFRVSGALPEKTFRGRKSQVTWSAVQHATGADSVQQNIALNANWPKQKKEAVVSARSVLQYCQGPDKCYCDISRHICNILRHFKVFFIYLFYIFAELWFGNSFTHCPYWIPSHLWAV
jgi:hypothetical protein